MCYIDLAGRAGQSERQTRTPAVMLADFPADIQETSALSAPYSPNIQGH